MQVNCSHLGRFMTGIYPSPFPSELKPRIELFGCFQEMIYSNYSHCSHLPALTSYSFLCIPFGLLIFQSCSFILACRHSRIHPPARPSRIQGHPWPRAKGRNPFTFFSSSGLVVRVRFVPSEGSGWSPDLLKCRYGGLEKRYDVMSVTQLGGRGMGGSYTIEGAQPKWEPTSRWPA